MHKMCHLLAFEAIFSAAWSLRASSVPYCLRPGFLAVTTRPAEKTEITCLIFQPLKGHTIDARRNAGRT